MDQFLKRCFYHSGLYNSEDHFLDLDSKLREKEVMLEEENTISDLLCHLIHIFNINDKRKTEITQNNNCFLQVGPGFNIISISAGLCRSLTIR